MRSRASIDAERKRAARRKINRVHARELADAASTDRSVSDCPTCRGHRSVPCCVCSGEGCTWCHGGSVRCDDCDGDGVVAESVADEINLENQDAY